jgi:hypothetical protein
MNTEQHHQLTIGSTRVVTHRDPEMADMVNIYGEVTTILYYVEAHSPRGEVFVHKFTSDAEFEIEDLLANMNRKLADGGKLDAKHWTFSRISYGAPGWEEQELAEEVRDAQRAGEWHPMMG